jgi:hypothetical protein
MTAWIPGGKQGGSIVGAGLGAAIATVDRTAVAEIARTHDPWPLEHLA